MIIIHWNAVSLVLLLCRASYSQKTPQRVALLFEDEGDDEDKGFLFGPKPAVTTNTEAPAKASALASLLFYIFVRMTNLLSLTLILKLRLFEDSYI